MKTRTTDLLNELSNSSHIDKYLKENDEYLIDQALSKFLCDMLEEKSLSKSDVILLTKAEIMHVCVYMYIHRVCA